MSYFKAKTHQIQFRLRLRSGGAYTAPPDPRLNLRRHTSKGREGREGRGNEERKGKGGKGKGGEGKGEGPPGSCLHPPDVKSCIKPCLLCAGGQFFL